MPSPVRNTSWMLGACAVAASWVIGLFLWGAPDSTFEPVLPLWNLAFVGVVGAPAMVMAALAASRTVERAASRRTFARTAWLVGICLLMWPTSFVHFGGSCLDENDVCMVRWPSRIAGLVLALGLLTCGWLGTSALVGWRGSQLPESAGATR